MIKYFSSRKALLLFLIFTINLFGQDKPKNIIILIGDGMGLNYVSLSTLSMENDAFKKFNSIGLSITAAADRLITDSAAGATAISTGHRTNYYYVGVDTLGRPLETVMEYASALGKSTGIVATSTITHATPGAFLAHVSNRKEEATIASQYLQSKVDVAIGGGLKFFIPQSKGGQRTDGIDLRDSINRKGYDLFTHTNTFLGKEEFSNKFYALLDSSSLPKAKKRDYTLADLTRKALNLLEKNEEGFILMVEGSQIDWAGHENLTDYVFEEMEDFNTAINEALTFFLKDKNTLVLVTADHETGGMAITGGNAARDSIKLSYTTKGHSGEMVGVFAMGPGEELFRGVYDNFMIGRKLFSLLGKDIK